MIWMLLGAALALGLVVWLARRGGGRRGGKSAVEALWRELRRLTHDESAAARLVAAERARHPELSEIALLRKVVRRLLRDRR